MACLLEQACPKRGNAEEGPQSELIELDMERNEPLMSMSAVILNDLIAQSSVDPALEAKLIASVSDLDDFIKVANDAGYPLTKDGLVELSDEQLSGVIGGVYGQDHKKWIDVLSSRLDEFWGS